MKLTVKSGALIEAASEASLSADRVSVAGSRGLYLKAVTKGTCLYAYSTNQKSRILTKIAAAVQVDGEVVVPPDKIPGILKGVPSDEDVKMELNEAKNQLKITYKGGWKKLPATVDVNTLAHSMGQLPFKGTPCFSIKGSTLEEYCRRGMACAPQNDDLGLKRPAVCLKVWNNRYQAVATDSVVAVRSRSNGNQATEPISDLLVCADSMPALGRLLSKRREQTVDIILGPVNDNQKVGEVFFRFGDVFFGSRLLDGRYPDVGGMLDQLQPKYWCGVPVDALKLALQRNSPLMVDEKSRILLEMGSTGLRIAASSESGDGDDQVEFMTAPEPAPKDGEARITVNFNYLSSTIAALRSQQVRLGLSGPKSPMVLEETVDDIDSRYAMAGIT